MPRLLKEPEQTPPEKRFAAPFHRRLRARSQPLPPLANLFLLNLFRGKKEKIIPGKVGRENGSNSAGRVMHLRGSPGASISQREMERGRGFPSLFSQECRFSLPWKRLMPPPWAAGQGRAVAFGRGRRCLGRDAGQDPQQPRPARPALRQRRGRSRPEPRCPSPRSCGSKTTTFVHSKPRQTAQLVYTVGFDERINCFL